MSNHPRKNFEAGQNKAVVSPAPFRREKGARTAPAPGAQRNPLPEFQAPQLCTLVDDPPEGQDWVSEIKFDGYRLIASIDQGTVRLLTRNGHDWADRLPAVNAAFGALPVRAAMLDGELVSLQSDGVSSFPGLQAALKAGLDHTLIFYAFDLLHLNGWDVRPCALLHRKRLLAPLIKPGSMLRYSDHHQGQGHEMRQGACRMNLEGIVCKRADAPYSTGRVGTWRKVKCLGREEFIVLGWTKPGGGRIGIGALQLGYWDPEGSLHYAGAVGTGFSDLELTRLHDHFEAKKIAAPNELLVTGEPVDPTTVWIKPDLVAEVKYTGWAGSGRMRHAVYLGLREDKSASEVVREVADPEALREPYQPVRLLRNATTQKSWHGAAPPRRVAALVSRTRFAAER